MVAPKNTNAANKPVDTTGWSKEQIGFDPYWTPEEGKRFVGTLLMRDERDPAFVRYQFRAEMDVECQRGPAADGQMVHVAKGETFNISMYAALEKTLDEYVNFSDDTGTLVMVEIIVKVPVTTKNQPKCWQFDANVPPATKALLNAWRSEHKKALAGGTQREQLQQ